MCFMSGYFAWNLQLEPLSSNSLVRSPDAFTAYENNVKEKSPTWRSIKTHGATKFAAVLSIWSSGHDKKEHVWLIAEVS